MKDQIKLLKNEFEREETNAKRIRALFENISERMLTIQKAIDGITPSTHEPIVNLMACAHVSAAFGDHGTKSLRKQKKPSNTFFIERGRITR